MIPYGAPRLKFGAGPVESVTFRGGSDGPQDGEETAKPFPASLSSRRPWGLVFTAIPDRALANEQRHLKQLLAGWVSR